MYAKELQIIFIHSIVNLDRPSERFIHQTFHEVYQVSRCASGIMFKFDVNGPEYFHPWHIIERVRIVR